MADSPPDLSPLRSTIDAMVRQAQIVKVVADEAKVRELLGRWVSGCEPAVAWRDNDVIGLCDADVPLGATDVFILK